jgi:hypothetical protein
LTPLVAHRLEADATIAAKQCGGGAAAFDGVGLGIAEDAMEFLDGIAAGGGELEFIGPGLQGFEVVEGGLDGGGAVPGEEVGEGEVGGCGGGREIVVGGDEGVEDRDLVVGERGRGWIGRGDHGGECTGYGRVVKVFVREKKNAMGRSEPGGHKVRGFLTGAEGGGRLGAAS